MIIVWQGGGEKDDGPSSSERLMLLGGLAMAPGASPPVEPSPSPAPAPAPSPLTTHRALLALARTLTSHPLPFNLTAHHHRSPSPLTLTTHRSPLTLTAHRSPSPLNLTAHPHRSPSPYAAPGAAGADPSGWSTTVLRDSINAFGARGEWDWTSPPAADDSPPPLPISAPTFGYHQSFVSQSGLNGRGSPPRHVPGQLEEEGRRRREEEGRREEEERRRKEEGPLGAPCDADLPRLLTWCRPDLVGETAPPTHRLSATAIGDAVVVLIPPAASELPSEGRAGGTHTNVAGELDWTGPEWTGLDSRLDLTRLDST